MCNGNIVLQQIFLRCFCLACVPNHYVLNMGLIYYTQLTLTNTDLSSHSKNQSPQRSVENPTQITFISCMGMSINNCLTDKYEKWGSPKLQFSTAPSHFKKTSLRWLESISRNKTLEQHLPKSNDATIHLTVVEVPSPDVTLSVKEPALRQSRNWFLPSWKYWSGFKNLWWVQLYHLYPRKFLLMYKFVWVNQSINQSIN